MPSYPHMPDNEPAIHWTVSDIESPSVGLLRDEYSVLARSNKSILDTFDPVGSQDICPLVLATEFSEIEQKEPLITQLLREQMLQSIGLGHVLKPIGAAPDLLADYEYSDGSRTQIRHITRPDTLPVALCTTYERYGDALRLEEVELLSDEGAKAYIERTQRLFDEAEMDSRLAQEFGLTGEFTNQADLDYEDKKGMLDAFAAISALETYTPDLSEELAVVDDARHKLVKAMLPAIQLLKNYREPRLPELAAQYKRQLDSLAAKFGLDESEQRALFAQERLFRLSALNRQLTYRKRAAMIGAFGVATYGGMVGAVTGFGIGELGLFGSPLGDTIGIGIIRFLGSGGTKQAIKLFKNRQQLHGGFNQPRDVGGNIDAELDDEYTLAAAYYRFIKRY